MSENIKLNTQHPAIRPEAANKALTVLEHYRWKTHPCRIRYKFRCHAPLSDNQRVGIGNKKNFYSKRKEISVRREPASDGCRVRSGLVAADFFKDFAGAVVEQFGGEFFGHGGGVCDG